MRKLSLSILILTATLIIIPNPVMAHCPLCTTGAAVGVGFARAYGVDDSIVGLLLGALIVSSALWFNNWLKKKINFPFQETLIIAVSFLLIVAPFYYYGLIIDFNMVKSMPYAHGMAGLGVFGLAQFGIDKLLFGIILGTLLIWGVFSFSGHITKKRGKRLFDYQGLILMLTSLIVLSLILYLITR